MTDLDKAILDRFKSLLRKRVQLHRMILFGSRARGDAEPYSDMDVVVVLKGTCDEQTEDYVSNCAWEAGFEHGVVIVPVVYSRHQWERGIERHSLLAQAVQMEGVAV